MSYFNSITIDGITRSAITDAFGRIRVANPETLFESKLPTGKGPINWDELLTSGGTSTHVSADACVNMAVAANGDAVTRQTWRRFNYQPGKSQLIFMTGVALSANDTSVTAKVVVRKNGSDTAISQSSWNIDRLDGSGGSANPSGITLDFKKAQIFVIDFEWLGVGAVRFGFVIDGIIYYCHEARHSNSSTSVYMSTPNMPLRYEVTANTASTFTKRIGYFDNGPTNAGSGNGLYFEWTGSWTTSSTLTQICTTVISEGGRDVVGYQRSAGRLTSAGTWSPGFATGAVLGAATMFPIVAIRLRSTAFGISVSPISFNVVCNTTADMFYALLLNPTITGTALSFITTGLSNSAVEYDIARTNASYITPPNQGIVIDSGVFIQNTNTPPILGQSRTELFLGAGITGTPDVLVLAAGRIGSTNETIYGSITWREGN